VTVSRHPFDVDTAVAPTGEHRFAATITDRWNGLTSRPNGGYSLAVCLRALACDLPFPDPLAVSAFFLQPVLPGPVELRSNVARCGRRMATGEVRLLQDSRERLRVVATFADLTPSSGDMRLFTAPPVMPAPETAVDAVGDTSQPAATITDRIEYRMAAMPGWRRGTPTGRAATSLWMRFKDGRDADTMALPMLVDAAAPAVLELGETGSSTLELTVHVRARPAPGWLACRIVTRCVAGGYHEEDFEVWDSAGMLVAQSRQLALLPRR